MKRGITRGWSRCWRAAMAAAIVGCGGQATVEDGPGPSGGSGGSGGSGADGGGGSGPLTFCEWLDDGNFDVLKDDACKACMDETLNNAAVCGNVHANPYFDPGPDCDELSAADAEGALAILSCSYCEVCASVCQDFSPHCE